MKRKKSTNKNKNKKIKKGTKIEKKISKYTYTLK